jgi:hypothetical protein
MSKEEKFVKALYQGTTEGNISWREVDKKWYKNYFNDPGEYVEAAYFYESGENKNKIVVFKSKSYLTDEFGESLEQSNVHVVFTKSFSYEQAYKISDVELEDQSILWTLFKIIQRQASKADDVMDNIIDQFYKFEF